MSLTLYLGGETLPDGVSWLREAFNFERKVGERMETSLTLIDTTGEMRPYVGQGVEIYENGDIIFGGVVDMPEREKLRPGVWQIELECVDWHYLADKRTVNQVFVEQTAGSIVTQIIDEVLSDEGVTEGEIADGPLFERVNSPRLYAAELLDELAEESGLTWHINADKSLDLYERGKYTGAKIDESSPILWGSLSVGQEKTDYRNTQILRKFMAFTGEQQEKAEPRADGDTQTFRLRFEIARKPDIYIVDEDTEEKTQVDPGEVGIQGLDDDKEWYWNRGSKEVSQDSDEDPIEDGYYIEVHYIGQYLSEVEIDDAAQIDERQQVEGGSGIYEHVTDAKSVEGIDNAVRKAEGKLRKYGLIPEKIDFDSYEIDATPGEVRQVSLPSWGIEDQFLVQKVAYSDEGRADGKLLRSYELVSGEVTDGFANFFKKVVTATRDLSIREDEVVQLFARLTEQDLLDLADILETHEAEPPFQYGVGEETNVVYGRWQYLGNAG